MNLFVNDIPVRILKPGKEPHSGDINLIIDVTAETLTKAKLIHHVWIQRATVLDLGNILDLINSKVPMGLRSLYISMADYDTVKEFLKKKFKVVKAAGGLIRKKEKFLMIYRMKKWDLP